MLKSFSTKADQLILPLNKLCHG